MYTGLIETIGTVTGIRPIPGGKELRIRHSFAESFPEGASVAVNGVCLSVTRDRDGFFTAECYFETLRKTTLDRVRPGTKVNLERPLRMDSPVDGHLVQGHITGIVRVLRIVPRGRGRELAVSLPEGNRSGLVREGSVALDGVSLTIADLRQDSLSVQLIGDTLDRTTLKDRRPGEPVNMESDFLLRAHGEAAGTSGTITMGRLAQWGYE